MHSKQLRGKVPVLCTDRRVLLSSCYLLCSNNLPFKSSNHISSAHHVPTVRPTQQSVAERHFTGDFLGKLLFTLAADIVRGAVVLNYCCMHCVSVSLSRGSKERDFEICGTDVSSLRGKTRSQHCMV